MSSKVNTPSQYIQYTLADEISLRKEYFGGIVFHRKDGTLIEVDKDAFRLLEQLQSMQIIDEKEILDNFSTFQIHPSRIKRCLTNLRELGVICRIEDKIPNKKQQPKDLQFNQTHLKKIIDYSTNPISNENTLTAPETLHWAITYKCPSNCPDCYVRRYAQMFPTELTTAEAFRVIDIIAQWGVFQIAIGGGEPLCRLDIVKIIDYAKSQDLMIHLTTGLRSISQELIANLSRSLTSLQIGIRTEILLNDHEHELKALSKIVNSANSVGLFHGANLILSNSTLEEFNAILEDLNAIGFRRITLLRYKPPAELSRWNQENPSQKALIAFKSLLNNATHNFPQIEFRIDCALSFLQASLPSRLAQRHGIHGCCAADRILALTPDGRLFPCSQLILPNLQCGQILNDDIHDLWYNHPILQRYRSFRQQSTFKAGTCGTCGMQDQCGGCRIFSQDHLGFDTGCPLKS